MADLIDGLGGTQGFGEIALNANDDGSTEFIDVRGVFENGLNFFGTTYDGFFVNNNGNVTFETSLSTFTPFTIDEASEPGIFPYFADVDTRGGSVTPTPGGNSSGSNLVYVDLDEAGDRVVVTWDDVGYFDSKTDLINAFQLVIEDTSDEPGGAAGDFRFSFRYEDINWTSGDVDSPDDNGLGGIAARAGWSSGNGTRSFELPQSGFTADLLTLEQTPGNTDIDGVWEFEVDNGDVVAPPDATTLEGCVYGDPRVQTLDGVNYDFMAVGEFILAETVPGAADPFQIQTRFEPTGRSSSLTETSQVATELAGARVTISNEASGGVLRVDGALVSLAPGAVLDLDGDGAGDITFDGREYTLSFAGGETLSVRDSGGFFTVCLRVPPERAGEVRGLLGDADGDTANDIAQRNGTVLPQPAPFDQLYGPFAESWRVDPADDDSRNKASLFDYPAGLGTEDFTDRASPTSVITLADLPAELAAAATAIVNAQGINDPIVRENAIIDVAVTGNTAFAESAATVLTAPTVDVETLNAPDLAPTLGVSTSAATLLEGTGGTRSVIFTVFRLGETDGPLVVPYVVRGIGADDVANPGALQGLVRFADGEETATVTLQVTGDPIGEADEELIFRLLPTDGFEFVTQQAEVTILDDDFNGDTGTNAPELIEGTSGSDLIRGLPGDDTLEGRGGFDLLFGGAGDDLINGGFGNDILVGRSGGDTLNGAQGDDVLAGAGGEDHLDAGGGHDRLFAGAGNDSAFGRAGDDLIVGGDGDDILGGGFGNDTIVGGGGDDIMAGSVGNDVILGGDGRDQARIVADIADVTIEQLGDAIRITDDVGNSGTDIYLSVEVFHIGTDVFAIEDLPFS